MVAIKHYWNLKFKNMVKDRKIYVVGHAKGYANWMEGLVVNKMEDANLVVFTGGEDVTPSLYGQPRHPMTYTNLDRDLVEKDAFNKAKELNIPCIGICRGSQLLCVLSGGLLVQDQPNPKYIHAIKTYDGKELNITSTHHQAAYPYNIPENQYKILGWTENMLKHHKDGKNQELNPPKECEIVYYPTTKCLGIQGHPEDMEMSSDTITYLRELLNKFLNESLQ